MGTTHQRCSTAPPDGRKSMSSRRRPGQVNGGSITERRPKVMPYCYAIYVVRLARYGRTFSSYVMARLGLQGRSGQERRVRGSDGTYGAQAGHLGHAATPRARWRPTWHSVCVVYVTLRPRPATVSTSRPARPKRRAPQEVRRISAARRRPERRCPAPASRRAAPECPPARSGHPGPGCAPRAGSPR